MFTLGKNAVSLRKYAFPGRKIMGNNKQWGIMHARPGIKFKNVFITSDQKAYYNHDYRLSTS